MRSILHMICQHATLFFFGLMLFGCVQFKPQTLYDGLEPIEKPTKPEILSIVVEPVIFRDNAKDMWGLKSDSCQTVSLTSEFTHSGTEAIDLEWNPAAGGCDFAGIGIGWDSYVGKDLTSIMDYAAIQFYVRSKSGRMFGLPIVLTLEDHSGGMGFSYTDNKYFERTAIDEEWQKVVVPLNSFEMEKENLDPSNIKQLQLELQQSGKIYLDDIELVYYTPEPIVPWMDEEVLPNPLSTPIVIFDKKFINDNYWGFIKDDCQNFEMKPVDSLNEGGDIIHAKWEEKEGCKLMTFGASWHKWKPVDLSNVLGSKGFSFRIKRADGSSESLPIKVGLEDYDRAVTYVMLLPKYVAEGNYDTNWRVVKIPLSDLPKGFDFSRTKQLMFNFEEAGEVFIDDIKFIDLKD
ncbi:hypothetical protein G3O08_04165 [Cryomorpha ignava]|uniref:CBM11 domain-containing protein n=1 Tax=Cryomorpha ignava TaxID=101383 RepID=A0A7K3WM21_9FLAO|nr:hypothetical protein [Cryomorpha ignava]NEN22699.1 hypothetical protein [Cryomorpha ignava]